MGYCIIGQHVGVEEIEDVITGAESEIVLQSDDPPFFVEYVEVSRATAEATASYLEHDEETTTIGGLEYAAIQYEVGDCETCGADCIGRKAKAEVD